MTDKMIPNWAVCPWSLLWPALTASWERWWRIPNNEWGFIAMMFGQWFKMKGWYLIISDNNDQLITQHDQINKHKWAGVCATLKQVTATEQGEKPTYVLHTFWLRVPLHRHCVLYQCKYVLMQWWTLYARNMVSQEQQSGNRSRLLNLFLVAWMIGECVDLCCVLSKKMPNEECRIDGH